MRRERYWNYMVERMRGKDPRNLTPKWTISNGLAMSRLNSRHCEIITSSPALTYGTGDACGESESKGRREATWNACQKLIWWVGCRSSFPPQTRATPTTELKPSWSQVIYHSTAGGPVGCWAGSQHKWHFSALGRLPKLYRVLRIWSEDLSDTEGVGKYWKPVSVVLCSLILTWKGAGFTKCTRESTAQLNVIKDVKSTKLNLIKNNKMNLSFPCDQWLSPFFPVTLLKSAILVVWTGEPMIWM